MIHIFVTQAVRAERPRAIFYAPAQPDDPDVDEEDRLPWMGFVGVGCTQTGDGTRVTLRRASLAS